MAVALKGQHDVDEVMLGRVALVFSAEPCQRWGWGSCSAIQPAALISAFLLVLILHSCCPSSASG